jgi:hypothetical protein
MRRFALLLVLGAAACGGAQRPTPPAPQSLTETLSQFLAAVKGNDITKMGNLWGTERGAASGWMDPTVMSQRLTVIQKYLAHSGYRILEGPIPATARGGEGIRNAPSPENLRTFRIELQREQCNRVVPIDLVRTRTGGWLVWDVHLESAGNPRSGCQPPSPGTGR